MQHQISLLPAHAPRAGLFVCGLGALYCLRFPELSTALGVQVKGMARQPRCFDAFFIFMSFGSVFLFLFFLSSCSKLLSENICVRASACWTASMRQMWHPQVICVGALGEAAVSTTVRQDLFATASSPFRAETGIPGAPREELWWNSSNLLTKKGE